jgi:hypothetical protein
MDSLERAAMNLAGQIEGFNKRSSPFLFLDAHYTKLSEEEKVKIAQQTGSKIVAVCSQLYSSNAISLNHSPLFFAAVPRTEVVEEIVKYGILNSQLNNNSIFYTKKYIEELVKENLAKDSDGRDSQIDLLQTSICLFAGSMACNLLGFSLLSIGDIELNFKGVCLLGLSALLFSHSAKRFYIYSFYSQLENNRIERLELVRRYISDRRLVTLYPPTPSLINQ